MERELKGSFIIIHSFIHRPEQLQSVLSRWPVKGQTAEWLAPSCAWLPFSRLCSSCLSSCSCCTCRWSSSHLLLHCCSFCCSSCVTSRRRECKRQGQEMESWACKHEANWALTHWVCHPEFFQMFCVEMEALRRANVDPRDMCSQQTEISVNKYLDATSEIASKQRLFCHKVRRALSLLPQYRFVSGQPAMQHIPSQRWWSPLVTLWK